MDRGRLVAATKVQTQFPEELAQALELFFSRPLMHSKEYGQLISVIKTCRRDVRTEHALLDQLVRIVSHHRYNSFNLAVLIEYNTGFHSLEIDCTAFVPCGAQHTIEAVQALKVGHTLAVDVSVTALLQHLTHLGVCQTGMRMNNRLIKTVFSQYASSG